jgi:phage baseplate assembly protein W
MRGTSAETGGALKDLDHLMQSIRDILTTPLGTRVMRRDYGSRLFDLVDRPMNPGLVAEYQAAVAEALDRWEPRFRLRRVRAEAAEPGRLTLRLSGIWLVDGREIELDGISL